MRLRIRQGHSTGWPLPPFSATKGTWWKRRNRPRDLTRVDESMIFPLQRQIERSILRPRNNATCTRDSSKTREAELECCFTIVLLLPHARYDALLIILSSGLLASTATWPHAATETADVVRLLFIRLRCRLTLRYQSAVALRFCECLGDIALLNLFSLHAKLFMMFWHENQTPLFTWQYLWPGCWSCDRRTLQKNTALGHLHSALVGQVMQNVAVDSINDFG